MQTYPQRRFALPPDAVEIVLIRHGASAHAVPGEPFDLIDGHADPALAPEGHEQAARVADRLGGEQIRALFDTPLRRTAQTAAPLAERLALQPQVIADLREVNLGDWEGGELRIREIAAEDLLGIRRHFRRLGLQTIVEGENLLVPPEQKLTVRDDQGDAIPKIDDGPWPAFPADLTSIALALATQADGTILIFEKMFENRLFFVDKLVAMGARITLCDPHRAIVSGPSRLHGARLESPDIRAGMAMLIAALAAQGTSEIGNVAQIDRGYERIDVRLRDLGARIERVASERVPA
jgi:hypothetical protein